MKFNITLLILALSILVVGTANARGRDHGGMRGPLGVVAHLGLDAETQAAVDDIVAEYQDLSESLDQKIIETRESVFSLMNSETPDRASVLAKVDEVNVFEGESRSARIAAMFDIRALLTPEQRAELVGMRRQSREQTLAVCSQDIQQLCPEFDGSRGALRCLAEVREELTPSCRDALPERRRDHHRHRDRAGQRLGERGAK